MKKVNYVYFILLLALWPAVDYMLSVGTRLSPWFLLLLPGYISWIIFSPALVYNVKKKQQLKSSFMPYMELKMEWCTFWLDKVNRELAVLFLLNPFKVQYIPIDRIEKAYARPEWLSEDKKHAKSIGFYLFIDGKKYKMHVYNLGRFEGSICIDGYGPGASALKEGMKLAAFIEELRK